ncbi:MAG: tripartite tricarboxylate transporter substrate binding protein [Betaproteobacteria bacterium]|nr:tripartite tricarboxylate transporter substrate binding protein [Betaproteobacteria bacterium]
MKTLHMAVCVLVGVSMLNLAGGAGAQQGYPSRPIRFIVPFAPGAGTDFVARLVGRKLTERLGQQVIVENRTGASGTIGTDLVAKSAPDGYTLLLGFLGPLALNPNLEKVPYSPQRDFAGVSLLASAYSVLVVHPSLPVKTVKDLIGLAKARPGELNYASSGTGTNVYLVSELFKMRTGIDMAHIPYKGTAPAAIALLSGEAQVLFGSVIGVLPHVRTNRLRALAVLSPKRSRLLSSVPTLVEAGVGGVDVAFWYALVVPAATPSEIVARLHADIVAIATTPDYQTQLERQGLELITSRPEQFSAFLQSELDKWGKVIKAAGIRAD